MNWTFSLKITTTVNLKNNLLSKNEEKLIVHDIFIILQLEVEEKLVWFLEIDRSQL